MNKLFLHLMETYLESQDKKDLKRYNFLEVTLRESFEQLELKMFDIEKYLNDVIKEKLGWQINTAFDIEKVFIDVDKNITLKDLRTLVSPLNGIYINFYFTSDLNTPEAKAFYAYRDLYDEKGLSKIPYPQNMEICKEFTKMVFNPLMDLTSMQNITFCGTGIDYEFNLKELSKNRIKINFKPIFCSETRDRKIRIPS